MKWIKPLNKRKVWKFVRTATVLIVLATITYVGWRQYQSAYNRELTRVADNRCDYPKLATLCELDMLMVGMLTVFAVIVAAVVCAVIIGIIYAAVTYVRGPKRCKNDYCRCRDHEQRRVMDASAFSGAITLLALAVSTLSIMITNLTLIMR